MLYEVKHITYYMYHFALNTRIVRDMTCTVLKVSNCFRTFELRCNHSLLKSTDLRHGYGCSSRLGQEKAAGIERENHPWAN